LDHIESVAFWKWTNKIHSNDLPRVFHYLMQPELPLLVPPHSHLLVYLAFPDVLLDLISHTGPPVVPFNQFLCAILSGMSRQWCVMVKTDDPVLQLVIPGDIDLFIVQDETCPPFSIPAMTSEGPT
jgi:hypothetical protein